MEFVSVGELVELVLIQSDSWLISEQLVHGSP